MRRYINPSRVEWGELTERAPHGVGGVEGRVAQILAQVKADGDRAVRELTEQVDGVRVESLEVGESELRQRAAEVSDELKEAIELAVVNITKFHKAQMPKTIDVEVMSGVRCVQKSVAIERVGLYIPGGSAPLFSTVLMLAVPAKLAGCKEIVIATPPTKEGSVAPAIAYAAQRCGVDRVYRIGGAMAIGAMAYGTESVPGVDKIFGPGNQYVTLAKQLVSSVVAIDMPAGPSEVMVIADRTAVALFVAADLLSQAEHGADSQAMLVCDSEQFADEVMAQIELQLGRLPRRDIAKKALENSRIIVLDEMSLMIDFANLYGAEHLIISTKDAWAVAEKITSAGSVFIGNYSPESAGDYASGTNHTLPTYGWTRSQSGVNMDSFMKKITFQELTRRGLSDIGKAVEVMADAEGLDGHKNAVSVRLLYKDDDEK